MITAEGGLYSLEVVNGVTAMGVRAVAVPILVFRRPGLMHSDCSKLLSTHDRWMTAKQHYVLVLMTKSYHNRSLLENWDGINISKESD